MSQLPKSNINTIKHNNMKHLRKFNSLTEFNSTKNTIPTPWIALVETDSIYSQTNSQNE